MPSHGVDFINFNFPNRPRFGLFSQPVGTAICETNHVKNVQRNVDEDGSVVTAPRNFYTNKAKGGKAEDSYFSKGVYLGGGPLQQAAINSMRTNVKDGWKNAGHERDFKPARDTQEKIYKMSYPYIEERGKKTKCYKDPEGGVTIGNRNFYTSPVKKGQAGPHVYLGGKVDFKGDDFDALRKITTKERLYHQSKL